MRTFKAIVVAVALSGILTNIFAKEIGTGTVEFGGTGSLGMQFSSGATPVSVNLDPVLNFFITDNVFAGPMVTFSGIFSSGLNPYNLGIGADFGILISNAGPVLPYLGAGAAYLNGQVVYSYYEKYSVQGFEIPIYLGVKFKISESIFFNLQPTFVYTSLKGNGLYSSNNGSLVIGLGFSGIL
jgi:hypothetical protein